MAARTRERRSNESAVQLRFSHDRRQHALKFRLAIPELMLERGDDEQTDE
jgi:hypothetical protein